jgi:hypothetical protein
MGTCAAAIPPHSAPCADPHNPATPTPLLCIATTSVKKPTAGTELRGCGCVHPPGHPTVQAHFGTTHPCVTQGSWGEVGPAFGRQCCTHRHAAHWQGRHAPDATTTTPTGPPSGTCHRGDSCSEERPAVQQIRAAQEGMGHAALVASRPPHGEMLLPGGSGHHCCAAAGPGEQASASQPLADHTQLAAQHREHANEMWPQKQSHPRVGRRPCCPLHQPHTAPCIMQLASCT